MLTEFQSLLHLTKDIFPAKGRSGGKRRVRDPTHLRSPPLIHSTNIWRICLVTGTRLGNINMNRIQFLT